MCVLDMTVTLHSTAIGAVHWIYCTAKLWFGSSGTRNSTDDVRRCTVTNRLAWVKTRSWLTLHGLVDLFVNLKLRMVAELPGSYCAWRLRRWRSRTVPHCLRWTSRTVPHCSRKWRPLEILELYRWKLTTPTTRKFKWNYGEMGRLVMAREKLCFYVQRACTESHECCWGSSHCGHHWWRCTDYRKQCSWTHWPHSF